MGTGAVSKLALAHPLQLSLLVGANLLACLGDGKVLSAGEGVTGLVVLGSGSLLFLFSRANSTMNKTQRLNIKHFIKSIIKSIDFFMYV
jgi:hypothetical protein